MKYAKNKNKILFITSFYSGVSDSIINNIWNPKGMPAIVKLLEALNVTQKTSTSTNFSSKLVVGAMGRLVKKKGFDFLVESFLEISDVKLLIAGSGKEFKSLKKITSENKNIQLLGWIRSKEKFFNNIIKVF